MIKFTKMNGLGNDYVYIDCINNKYNIDEMPKLAKVMSDRHFGIGSDGVICICNSDIADFKMRMFNQDGSEAEMCGNGIRCVGKFVYDKRLTNKKNITIETLAGIKQLKLNIVNEKVDTVKVDMGEPILDKEKIPVKCEKEKLLLKVDDKEFEFIPVSMGNPHAVTFINNVDKFDVERYGKIVEIDKHFPQKTNVEFIQILDKENIKMRVWERGTGETMACGTGACASVVASILSNYTNNNVYVHLLGGDLQIEWNKKNDHIYMTGPAEIVFEGEWMKND